MQRNSSSPTRGQAQLDQNPVMKASFDRVIVIGASAGGVAALLEITKALPPSFPAPVCIVQHVGRNPSILPDLLSYHRGNRAVHAVDGESLAPGTVYIAPPDRHLLLEDTVLHLTHGAKENHARPAIDPLFRTAAVAWGPRVIGVVLTGQLDDGSAGLRAIKDCGGTTIVQDPATAAEPEMPASALAAAGADHCVPLEEIAPLLARLVGAAPAPAQAPVPERLEREAAINRGDTTLETLTAIATPALLTCPDCGGTLSEVREERPLRFRCHTGHAFTARTLERVQADAAEQALRSGVRALVEREILLRRAASVASATGDEAQSLAALAQADRVRTQARVMEALVEEGRDAAGSIIAAH